jgi:tripartite-type tricarboxylate transporter receptor subunit TctC
MMIRNLVVACAVVAGWCAAPLAWSQTWPDRPIKMLVGFPPGGSTDLAARIVANKLSQALGQTVIVENRAGASGNIAADAVAQAAPDGYTLMMAATSFAAAPAFFDKLPWDPTRNFTPIAQVATVPILAVATPGVGIKSAAELVSYAKANPGKLNMASPGPTTLTRLSGEQFAQLAGVKWVTVHYKGGAPAMQDMLAGTAQIMFANISDVITQVKAGKLQAIAVASRNRSTMAPEIPTFHESGFPGFTFSTWQAVVGPANMPPQVVARLNAEIRKIVDDPDTKAQFLGFGTETATGTPQQLATLLAEEVDKIKRLAKAVGATNQ